MTVLKHMSRADAALSRGNIHHHPLWDYVKADHQSAGRASAHSSRAELAPAPPVTVTEARGL